MTKTKNIIGVRISKKALNKLTTFKAASGDEWYNMVVYINEDGSTAVVPHVDDERREVIKELGGKLPTLGTVKVIK